MSVHLIYSSNNNSSNLSPLSPLRNDTLDAKNHDFRCLWNHQIMVLRQEGLQIHLLPKHLDQGTLFKARRETKKQQRFIYTYIHTHREVSFHLVSSQVLVSWCFLAATGPVESRQLCLFRVFT